MLVFRRSLVLRLEDGLVSSFWLIPLGIQSAEHRASTVSVSGDGLGCILDILRAPTSS